jgi:hypothetical protein
MSIDKLFLMLAEPLWPHLHDHPVPENYRLVTVNGKYRPSIKTAALYQCHCLIYGAAFVKG